MRENEPRVLQANLKLVPLALCDVNKAKMLALVSSSTEEVVFSW